MIIEFLKDTPIEGSRKFFQAGQRYVFEKERGTAFVKSGAAREVRKLYTQAELEGKADNSMSVTEVLDMLANESQQQAEAEAPPQNKKRKSTKTKKK